ncbi:hypothetical protein HPP92_007652 [Vanilla planifolia]|uniref:Uncharacterized protein n=1 Tax=Vanilla planifolia TaxID=51239 RepID=A0A835RGG5_VANPL|nr:hypothetical protein HPP92_007863 [Vanilla planifolia]KAG0490789.1 hypothetical protein HPP92_007652 [Vanilla planifolia]
MIEGAFRSKPEGEELANVLQTLGREGLEIPLADWKASQVPKWGRSGGGCKVCQSMTFSQKLA